MKKTRTCPICGNEYQGEPAISRKDNRTAICPDCCALEAMDAVGATQGTKDAVLRELRKARGITLELTT